MAAMGALNDRQRRGHQDIKGEEGLPMKIEARVTDSDRDKHAVADAEVKYLRCEEDGNVTFTVRSDAITLTRGIVYNLFISVSPEEIDKIYRFSMTSPHTQKK